MVLLPQAVQAGRAGSRHSPPTASRCKGPRRGAVATVWLTLVLQLLVAALLASLAHAAAPPKYYEMLGVSKDATPLQIRKAYRKLALEYHPDKLGRPPTDEDQNKFIELTGAYEVLSDPEKRQMYDLQGGDEATGAFNAGAGGGGGSGGGDGWGGDAIRRYTGAALHLFSVDASHVLHTEYQPAPEVAPHVTADVNITLREAYTGCWRELNLTRLTVCSSCAGSRAHDHAMKPCPRCGGRGLHDVFLASSHAHAATYTRVTCTLCKGVGAVPVEPCRVCNATGVVSEPFTHNLTVPLGAKPGQHLLVPNIGSRAPRMLPGSLIARVAINEEDSNGFKVAANGGLELTLRASLVAAVLGIEHKLALPVGPPLPVRLQVPPWESHTSVVLAGRGIPNATEFEAPGDVRVELRVYVPTRISGDEYEALERAVGEEGLILTEEAVYMQALKTADEDDPGAEAFEAGAFCIEGDPLWSAIMLEPELCMEEEAVFNNATGGWAWVPRRPSPSTLCPGFVLGRGAYLGGGWVL